VANKRPVRKKVNPVQRYFRETIGELRKVSWPSRKEATSLTIIVLVVTVFMSAFLGFMDVIFTRLFAVILGA